MILKRGKILSCLPFAMIIILWSCSHKTLSIFFDGVPDPDNTTSLPADLNDTPEIAQNTETPHKNEAAQTYFNHAPFQQRECASCHDPNVMGQLQQPVPQLCYQCHDDYASKFKVLHAPVDAGECMICHSPHLALYNRLLNRPGQQVCYECHSPDDVLAKEPHGDIADADCTECHNPHGGEDQYMLN